MLCFNCSFLINGNLTGPKRIRVLMSFIIGKKCEGVCDTACVDVCPVDCIHGPILPDNRGQGSSKYDKR